VIAVDIVMSQYYLILYIHVRLYSLMCDKNVNEMNENVRLNRMNRKIVPVCVHILCQDVWIDDRCNESGFFV